MILKWISRRLNFFLSRFLGFRSNETLIPSRSTRMAFKDFIAFVTAAEIEQAFMIVLWFSFTFGDLRYYFYRENIENQCNVSSAFTTVQSSSLFNEISSLVSFPPVVFFSFSLFATISLSLFLFSCRFRSSFPNIFARIDDESQPENIRSC